MSIRGIPLRSLAIVAVAACTAAVLAACAPVDTGPKWDLSYAPGIASGNRIISDFHSRLDLDGERRSGRNQGIDISGPAGQRVIAIADGRVVEIRAEKCKGPTVAIDHGETKFGKTLIALYGRVGDVLVEEEQTVSRGEVIGRLGDDHPAFGCPASVRHLRLLLGSERRLNKASAWGDAYFLEDWNRAMNPHRLWADGPLRVTCFDESREYEPGTITYPMPCRR